MIKRWLVWMLLVLAPLCAYAADDAATLGPQGSNPAGASTTLNNILQPSSTQSLQNGAATNGPNAVQGNSAQSLQGAVPSDAQLQVIKSETDGTPVVPNPEANGLAKAATILFALIIIVIIAAISLAYAKKRSIPGVELGVNHTDQTNEAVPDTEPNPEAETHSRTKNRKKVRRRNRRQ